MTPEQYLGKWFVQDFEKYNSSRGHNSMRAILFQPLIIDPEKPKWDDKLVFLTGWSIFIVHYNGELRTEEEEYASYNIPYLTNKIPGHPEWLEPTDELPVKWLVMGRSCGDIARMRIKS